MASGTQSGEMTSANSSETAALRKDLAAFAAEHRRTFDDAERRGEFPLDLYREMGRRGWVGSVTPREFGGSGGGVWEYCVIAEEVGRLGIVSPQTAIQGELWLLDWGTDEQKAELLPGLANGDIVFSESISEPGVGSALRSVTSTAVCDGDVWVINGRKTHVNLGAESSLTVVYAVADEGLTAFLVPMDTPGVTTRGTDPIGLRLIPTADVDFDDVRVPSSAVLGSPGQGLKTFLSTFNTSRLGNASELIGLARRGFIEAVDYAGAREVGNNVVTDFQGLQWELTDCYQAISAAIRFRDEAAAVIASGEDPSFATSLAKSAAIDAAELTGKVMFGLVGGHGLYNDQPYWRTLADIKVLRTAGGSREVLRNFIAKQILRSDDLGGLR